MSQKPLLILSILFLKSVSPVSAADFATSIHQTYTLTATGADVTQTLTVTNQTDLLFPTGYTLFLPSETIQDLTITDQNNHSTTFTQSPVGGNTKVDITFTQPIVGKQKSQTYRLEYTQPETRPNPDHPQYVIGKPPLHNQQETITTTVIVPKTICPEPIVYPTDMNLKPEENFTSLNFSQSDSRHSATIFCQDKRYLNFTLGYQLVNPTVTPVETQITLPPDTSYQRIIFNQIQPQPLRLQTDADGNRIASYKLEPKQTLDLMVTAAAIITNPVSLYQDKNPDIPGLTKEQPYWPTTHPKIKTQAKQLPDSKAIFDFITHTAAYNPDQFTKSNSRHGGLQILDYPQDMTAEDFTDAFITLCRAQGIASRRLISYIMPANQKVTPLEYPDVNLHVYPEWYDSQTQTWIPVDPLWQKTDPSQDYWPVADQLRLTLAINGRSDSTPYPANSIQTEPSTAFMLPPPNLTASIQNPIISKLLPSKNNLIITNHSNYALYQESFTLAGPTISTQTIPIHRLDINSQGIIPITATGDKQLTLETQYGSIPVEQSYSLVSPTVAVTTVLVAGASVIAVITRRLLVHRRKR